MSPAELESFCSGDVADIAASPDWPAFHEAFLAALEAGSVTAVRRGAEGAWQAVPWVKKGILAGFRASGLVAYPDWPGGARDKSAWPPRLFAEADGVRLVPGGSSARRGAHIEAGVVIMPPAFINAGAWIGARTMVDSHALVGSCARVGEGVHLSAGVQLGGVLEPVGAAPVVVEDGAFIGALAAVLEGAVIRAGAVLAPGCIVSRSTPIIDLVHGREYAGFVPERAVVVPGSRPASGAYARERGVSIGAAIIVKYRDEGTDAALALEDCLR